MQENHKIPFVSQASSSSFLMVKKSIETIISTNRKREREDSDAIAYGINNCLPGTQTKKHFISVLT